VAARAFRRGGASCLLAAPLTVASLGLLSPGAATDGVILFFLENLTTFFQSSPSGKWWPFFSCRLLTTPIFSRRLSSVLSKPSRKKINFIRVSPAEWCHPGRSALPYPLWRHCPLEMCALRTVRVDHQARLTRPVPVVDNAYPYPYGPFPTRAEEFCLRLHWDGRVTVTMYLGFASTVRLIIFSLGQWVVQRS